jgi:Superinfection immunity protein
MLQRFLGLHPALICISVFVSLLVYFLPSIIAIVRGHKNALAIFVLDLFLGWTFLGWVGALVWSLTATGNTDASITTQS